MVKCNNYEFGMAQHTVNQILMVTTISAACVVRLNYNFYQYSNIFLITPFLLPGGIFVNSILSYKNLKIEKYSYEYNPIFVNKLFNLLAAVLQEEKIKSIIPQSFILQAEQLIKTLDLANYIIPGDEIVDQASTLAKKVYKTMINQDTHILNNGISVLSDYNYHPQDRSFISFFHYNYNLYCFYGKSFVTEMMLNFSVFKAKVFYASVIVVDLFSGAIQTGIFDNIFKNIKYFYNETSVYSIQSSNIPNIHIKTESTCLSISNDDEKNDIANQPIGINETKLVSNFLPESIMEVIGSCYDAVADYLFSNE